MSWFRRAAATPPEPVDPLDGVDREDTPEALRDELEQMVTVVNRMSGDLPTVAVVQAESLLDTLRQVIELSTVRPMDIHAVITVRKTLTDYLPTTLNAYERLPMAVRTEPRPSGQTPAQSLSVQLDALATAACSTLTAAENEDVDALMIQGAFLTTKFSRSDLDL